MNDPTPHPDIAPIAAACAAVKEAADRVLEGRAEILSVGVRFDTNSRGEHRSLYQILFRAPAFGESARYVQRGETPEHAGILAGRKILELERHAEGVQRQRLKRVAAHAEAFRESLIPIADFDGKHVIDSHGHVVSVADWVDNLIAEDLPEATCPGHYWAYEAVDKSLKEAVKDSGEMLAERLVEDYHIDESTYELAVPHLTAVLDRALDDVSPYISWYTEGSRVVKITTGQLRNLAATGLGCAEFIERFGRDIHDMDEREPLL